MTWNCVVPDGGSTGGCGTPTGETTSGVMLVQTSSRPKAMRAGAPLTSEPAVGSTSIQLLYQDCTPGAYETVFTPTSAVPLPGAASCWLSAIFVQLLPKSGDP